jgi:hypothetical protein
MKTRANRNSQREFYKNNKYTCEKLVFCSRQEAIKGIRNNEEARGLRPYNCPRCNCWHLTHKRTRTLFHTSRPKSNTIRPSDVNYKISNPKGSTSK